MIGTLTNFLRNGTKAHSGADASTDSPDEHPANDASTDASRSTIDMTQGTESELQWGLLADDGPSEPTVESNPNGRTNTESVAAGASESVASTLVDELRRGTVSEEERSALREELGVGVEPAPSVDVRFRQLQSEVADFRAYIDALEAFIDENGTAEQLATELRGRIDELDARLDDVEQLCDDVNALEAAHTEDVDQLEDRIGSVAKTLTDSLLALRTDVRTVSEDVEELKAWRRSITRAFDAQDSSDR